MAVPRPIDLTTRLHIGRAATRMFGGDLLVNVGGATSSVQRLLGTGPALWECFSEGMSVGEAAAALATRDGAPPDIETNVLAFAEGLVQSGVAEPVE